MPNSFWRKILWKAQRQNYHKGLNETEPWRSLTQLTANNSSISRKPRIPCSPEKMEAVGPEVWIVTENSKRCWPTHKLQEDQDGRFTQGLCSSPLIMWSPFICIKYIWTLCKRGMASWWTPNFLKRGSAVRSNYQLFLAWPAKQLYHQSNKRSNQMAFQSGPEEPLCDQQKGWAEYKKDAPGWQVPVAESFPTLCEPQQIRAGLKLTVI